MIFLQITYDGLPKDLIISVMNNIVKYGIYSVSVSRIYSYISPMLKSKTQSPSREYIVGNSEGLITDRNDNKSNSKVKFYFFPENIYKIYELELKFSDINNKFPTGLISKIGIVFDLWIIIMNYNNSFNDFKYSIIGSIGIIINMLYLRKNILERDQHIITESSNLTVINAAESYFKKSPRSFDDWINYIICSRTTRYNNVKNLIDEVKKIHSCDS